MSEDAMSQPSDQSTPTTSAIEDDQAQQMLAATQAESSPGGGTEPAASGATASADPKPDDGLSDSGKRALTSERQARRTAEKEAKELRERLQQFEDAQKSELQKAQEAAQRYEQELSATRVANARLMAAAVHNLPPDLIDLLGSGTDEEIDARARLLAEKLNAAAPTAAAPEPPKPAASASRPVESLTPGAKPASAEPEDPNAWLRRMAGRAP